MEVDLQSLFGLLFTAVLIGCDPATPPLPPHLGSYTRALLVSQGRQHLFVTFCLHTAYTGYTNCSLMRQRAGPTWRPAWVAGGEWPGRCDFVCDVWAVPACLLCVVLVALTGAAQMRADEISRWCYIVNVHNHPSWAWPRKDGMAWYLSRNLPSLWLPYSALLSAHEHSWEQALLLAI